MIVAVASREELPLVPISYVEKGQRGHIVLMLDEVRRFKCPFLLYKIMNVVTSVRFSL